MRRRHARPPSRRPRHARWRRSLSEGDSVIRLACWRAKDSGTSAAQHQRPRGHDQSPAAGRATPWSAPSGPRRRSVRGPRGSSTGCARPRGAASKRPGWTKCCAMRVPSTRSMAASLAWSASRARWSASRRTAPLRCTASFTQLPAREAASGARSRHACQGPANAGCRWHCTTMGVTARSTTRPVRVANVVSARTSRVLRERPRAWLRRGGSSATRGPAVSTRPGSAALANAVRMPNRRRHDNSPSHHRSSCPISRSTSIQGGPSHRAGSRRWTRARRDARAAGARGARRWPAPRRAHAWSARDGRGGRCAAPRVPATRAGRRARRHGWPAAG